MTTIATGKGEFVQTLLVLSGLSTIESQLDQLVVESVGHVYHPVDRAEDGVVGRDCFRHREYVSDPEEQERRECCP